MATPRLYACVIGIGARNDQKKGLIVFVEAEKSDQSLPVRNEWAPPAALREVRPLGLSHNAEREERTLIILCCIPV